MPCCLICFKILRNHLSQSENSLLVSNTSSLDEKEILFNLSVVRKPTHWINGFVSQIVICSSTVLDQLSINHLVTLANSIDLLVDLSTVMESLLSSPK